MGGKEKQQFVRRNRESESQGCLSTTSRSRTLAATLSSLSRCWSRAREVVSRWLCLLQSPGGMITGSAPHPGENHKQKCFWFFFIVLSLSAGAKQAGISHQRGGGKQQKIEMTHFYPIAKKTMTPRSSISELTMVNVL